MLLMRPGKREPTHSTTSDSHHQADRRSLLSRAPTEPVGTGMTSRFLAASLPAAAATAAAAAVAAEAEAEALDAGAGAAPGCAGDV
jgi:hypothetical protein